MLTSICDHPRGIGAERELIDNLARDEGIFTIITGALSFVVIGT